MKFSLIFSLFINGFIVQCQDTILPLYELLTTVEKKPLICGHRGGYYDLYPENSLSVIDYIYKAGSEKPLMLEIDVRKDKDGILWLLHDNELTRTTNGEGDILSKKTSELSQIFLMSQNDSLTKEHIPTLTELLDYIKDKHIYLMLDVKGDIYDQVLDLVKKYNLDNRCLVLTFTIDNTKKVLSSKSNVMVSALIDSDKDYASLMDLHASKESIAAYITDKTSDKIIHKIKNVGLITLSDPREVWNKRYQPFTLQYYDSLTFKRKLDILVTDFPIEVAKMFQADELKKQSIHAIHLKKFKWLAEQQYDSLSTLLHDDVHYIHSNGWKESKADVIANLKSGKLTYTEVKVHESDVRLISNTGVVTGKGTFYVSMDGKPYSFDLYYTEVYVNTDTGIKLISRHACKYEKKD